MSEEKRGCCCGKKTTMRSEEERKKLINRLSRIEGQIRGTKECWKMMRIVMIFWYSRRQQAQQSMHLTRNCLQATFIPVLSETFGKEKTK